MIPPEPENKFSSLKISSTYSIPSRLFALNIVLKDLFFVICNNIFFLERRLVTVDMRSFLFFSLWLWVSPKTSLLTFPIFFKWQPIGNWHVLGLCATSLVLVRGLYFIHSLKSSWSRLDGHPGMGSSLNGVSPERNFENQFRTWWLVMTPWP